MRWRHARLRQLQAALLTLPLPLPLPLTLTLTLTPTPTPTPTLTPNPHQAALLTWRMVRVEADTLGALGAACGLSLTLSLSLP